MSSFLKDIVRKWNLENLVTMVVSDNASNIIAAIKLCNWRSLGCFAHSINLVVESGLKYEDVKSIIAKVKAIVQYFKQSSQALIRLNDNQVKGGHPILKLKQDCPTRWNSTYDMINRILKIKEPVLSTLAVINNDLNNITNNEWNILDHLCKLLKIFYDITNEISCEKFVSISKVLIFSKAMSDYVLVYCNDQSMPYEINSVANILHTKLKQRFNQFDDNDVVIQSTLLDPRFKKQGFVNDRKYEIAYESLSRKVQGISIGKDSQEPEINTPYSEPAGSETIWKDFDSKVSKLSGGGHSTVAGILELDRYLAEPLLKRTADPLVWWHERKLLYPRLYLLACRRLCIVATSVPCERIFSKAGLVLTDRRSRLNSRPTHLYQ